MKKMSTFSYHLSFDKNRAKTMWRRFDGEGTWEAAILSTAILTSMTR